MTTTTTIHKALHEEEPEYEYEVREEPIDFDDYDHDNDTDPDVFSTLRNLIARRSEAALKP